MKNILYFSDSKFPLAGLAGAIHSGLLPVGRFPAGKELWNLHFLNLKKNWEGKILSLGEDRQGNKIYALSVKGERGMINRLVESFLMIYHIPDNELRLVDSRLKENGFLLAGRMLGRVGFLGRFFSFLGIKLAYSELTRLIQNEKKGLAKLP